MTLVSQIISDAYRQSNLLALSATPTSNQNTEGLRYLNRIMKAAFGIEVGEDFQPLPIGRNNISRPSGYPWYNTTPSGDWFCPQNTRLVLNLEESLSVYLHPEPRDGARFSVSDVSNNLATYNLTVYGNGRTIEDASSVTLSTNGLDREWFFRADTNNWVKYSELLLSDVFPFPPEFDDFFITKLAIRLNPAYGAALDNQSASVLTRAEKQLKARYSQKEEMWSEKGLIKMPFRHSLYCTENSLNSSSTELFNAGRTC